MDQGAVKQIQQTAIQATQPEVLGKTSVPTVLVAKDMQVESLERFMPERFRFRGTVATTSVASFVQYVMDRQHAGICDPVCFIDAQKMSAAAIFNFGNTTEPGHADDRAVLTLEQSAPYRALLQVDGMKMAQKDAAEWLEDWRANLHAFGEDEEPMEIKKAIGAIRRAVIDAKRTEDHSVGAFGAAKTAMEQIEAKGRENPLPASFSFTCIPYEGLTHRSFVMRMSLLTGQTGPVFVLRIIQLEKAKEEMAQEFRDLLDTNFTESEVETYVGTFTP